VSQKQGQPIQAVTRTYFQRCFEVEVERPEAPRLGWVLGEGAVCPLLTR